MFIVCLVLVHCRVGSLEIKCPAMPPLRRVHCRVGSLEIVATSRLVAIIVHCRVGSLEMWGQGSAS